MTARKTLHVAGMTCGGCENAVKRVLKQLDGVTDVTASHVAGTVDVTYDADKVQPAAFTPKIEALGYRVVS